MQKSPSLRHYVHAVCLCLHCYCGILASPSVLKAGVCFSIAVNLPETCFQGIPLPVFIRLEDIIP